VTATLGTAALVVVPFAAAVLGLCVGRWRPLAVLVACAGAAATLGLAIVLALPAWSATIGSVDVWATVPTGWVPITVSTRSDGLTASVAVMVAVVALAVQAYSPSYLHGEPRYGSYAALVSLFTAAMQLVVVADDLVVLLVGWEIMGICSYFLVGHYWEQPWARSAAVKAFVVTRLGDIGLLFGVFVLADLAGSFQLSEVTSELACSGTGCAPPTALTVGTLLVLCGVAGKSAQVPLHVWLPDAMAGPTPISALIHAATMVAAGVFLVARLFPVMAGTPVTMAVLAVIAAVTMLGTALAALAQDDLKRVLAYSTSSQLAYMLGGLAVGGYSAALVHLVGHAAFKALLFLAAGAILHAAGTGLLSELGGLARDLPVTYRVTTLGFLALVGVPPLVGFVGKESVISSAWEAARHGGPVPWWAAALVLVSGFVTIAVTAAYATRAWLLAFHGPRPADRALHRVPLPMLAVLISLAVPVVGLGLLALVPGVVGRAASGSVAGAPLPEPAGLHLDWWSSVAALALVAVFVLVTWLEWLRVDRADPAAGLGRARAVLATGLGFDRRYDELVVQPVWTAARLTAATDREVVAPLVASAGGLVAGAGRLVRATQTGRVQVYLTVVLVAVVLLAVAGAVL
jgi:NADH-quinone oxidoreductase subunit L